MFLTAGAFAAAAVLQEAIQTAGDGVVHGLWQIIPYFIMTVAEVLVSITGLEFAYTQAPRAMKSTIMSFWLLCVTFGNLLVAFLAPLQKTIALSTFFWLFAGLMAVRRHDLPGLGAASITARPTCSTPPSFEPAGAPSDALDDGALERRRRRSSRHSGSSRGRSAAVCSITRIDFQRPC